MVLLIQRQLKDKLYVGLQVFPKAMKAKVPLGLPIYESYDTYSTLSLRLLSSSTNMHP